MSFQIMNRGRRATPVLASRRDGGSHWFNDKQEVNASSRKDLIETLSALITAKESGQVAFADPNAAETANELSPAQRLEEVRAAYHDHTSGRWAEMGTSIGAILYETALREGFMRRFLKQGELLNGSIPRINVRFQNVDAIVTTSPQTVVPMLVKQRYIYPPEYYVLGNIRVPDIEIAQGAPDILEDAFARAMENINVKEDLVLVRMLDETVSVVNPLFLLAGGLTPSNLSATRTALLQWGLQASQLLIASDFWTDIAGNAASFGNLFDPVTRYELVQTGFLGTLLGMDITTDAFRDPQQKVVLPNNMYILSEPINLGAYTDRGPVKSVPQDNYNDGIPGRGWWFSELLSTVVTNPRAVVKATRT
jgi:hypothetical protein